MPEILSRYYTEDNFSALLVSEIKNINPLRILDIGVGKGALLKAAIAKWTNASFYAIDIDSKNLEKLKLEVPDITIKKINGLSPNLPYKLNLSVNSVDIAVCNPPYLKVEKEIKYEKIFYNIGFENCVKMPFYTSDTLFLSQNLHLLKEGGELGIILPDSLLTSKYFLNFRKDLLTKVSIQSVIQLPDNVFAKTEARTHILIIKKGSKQKNKIPLHMADKEGFICDSLKVNKNNLFYRMDFKYHRTHNNMRFYQNHLKLGDISLSIRRGKFSKKELVDLIGAKNFIHLNNLKYPEIKIKNKKVLSVGTEIGDILVARVGKGCVGRTSFIRGGNAEISDCVYRIRVPKIYQKAVFNTLNSKIGQTFLFGLAHGVCSKLINKKDLESIPIFLK